MDCLPAGYVADAFQQVSVTLLVNYSKHWMETLDGTCERILLGIEKEK